MAFKDNGGNTGVRMEDHYKKPDLPNCVNRNADVASELEEREVITDGTFCAMKKMLPFVLEELAKIKDYRKKKVKYSQGMLLAYGILMFALHYSSRRETNREMTTPILRENLKALFPELEFLPHGDTLYRLLDHIDVGKIEEAQVRLLQKMVKDKKFANYLVGKKYRIAINGTQKLARKGECGDEYLIRHIGTDRVPQSYIYVLEAVLVLGNGMVIPFMSEFLTNEDNGKEAATAEQKKQDSERKAFRRLAKRIKETFPRLNIVLMMDSLYAAGPIFCICRNNNWDYMINFKKGSMPSVYKEAESLMELTPENTLETMWGDRKQTYSYINGIDYEFYNTDI